MTNKQKRVFYSLLLIALVYFILFGFPNAVGSNDHNMLAIFEPDEFAQYPYMIQMLRGGDSLRQALRRFFIYHHYYYGFPFYFLSALTIFPLKILNGLSSTTQIMWMLRQFVGIVPMVIAALIFVYLFTRFKRYLPSIATFIFLLTIPAIVHNSLWWHPDSLTTLFIALTFFFLDRDDLQFGKNFYFSSIACGLAVGTKLIGLFFFLAIPMYIVWGVYEKRIDLKQAFLAAARFVFLMFFVLILSNPMLVVPEVRDKIIKIQQKQSEAMAFGWQVAYDKGPQSWYKKINENYGNWYFIGLSFIATVIGLIRGPKRFLNALVLAWVLPFSLYILYFIAIKPNHFFIPIALPLFAVGLNIFSRFPKRKDLSHLENWKKVASHALFLGCIVIVGFQFASNISSGYTHYVEKLEREKNSAAISFFTQIDAAYLSKIPDEKELVIYRDIRVYVPNTTGWDLQYKWGVVDLEYIQTLDPDVVLLSRQRALDYTSPGVIEKAENPAQMKKTFDFYQSALESTITGYNMVYEDNFGLAFIRDDISQTLKD